MLDSGVDPNFQNRLGTTALMMASAWGYTEIVRLLLENGADPNIGDEDGDTPLFYAPKNSEVYKILLEKEQNK